jgi:hypothetical protein
LIKEEVLATTGPTFFPQTGEDEKSTPSGRINKIHFDGFDLLKEVFVDNIRNSFFRENLVILAWFILNQTQGGPRSASLVVGDPDARDLFLVLKSFLNHLRGLFRNFKHGLLLL